MSVNVQHSLSTFIMQKTLQLFYVLLLSPKIHSSQQCPLLEFLNFNTDTLSVPESSLVNLTFWLNDSGCKKSDVVYRVVVQTKLDVGSWEYDGRLFQTNQCTEITSTFLGCLSAAGPARLYKVLNRSHEEIEWIWTWKDSGDIKTMKKGLKLYVLYPPSVESLTVDGHEANGTYLLNDGQKVNVLCSFEKGNPASRFHLLNKSGAEMATPSTDKYINHSLTVHCKDDWPKISCEGKRSKQNRSVSFLVKCPPQFVNSIVKIDSSSDEQTITLHVKSYSSATGKCFLTPLSSLNNTERQVNCNIRGEPPDLVLSFPFANENSSIKEWILTYQNEEGSANITIILNKYLEDDTEKDPLLTDKNDKIGNSASLEEKSADLRGSFTEDISTDSHLHNHTYVSASAVRNLKKGRSKGESSSGPAEETYTSATEVRAKKRQEKLEMQRVNVYLGLSRLQ
ncbi:uncharacterized protein LOC112568521 isoform X2 [Pomacea canaliculata]|uniref:uncharacterized protein LOC112568521 isoform X2 n=1 Tax=Pomacea canaliculata TaxID=400727 RepID=UPI000D72A00E|nr:uncharacterized protein LOC112568521 isoform X2 [Pomacea canaliculata]